MKRWMRGVLVMLALMPAAAWAQNAGYNRGFYIQNEDQTFKLRINGRVQNRLQFSDSEIEPRVLSFTIRRANINFNATVHEKMSFGFVLLHATNSKNFNTLNVAQAVASYEFTPAFTMAMGMVGLPMDFASEFSSSWFLLANPPFTVTQDDGGAQAFTSTRPSFGVPDGLGVNISGGISKFFYSASVVNGAESNYNFNPNMRMSAGARLGVNVIGEVDGGKMGDFAYSETPNWALSVGGMYQAKRTDDVFCQVYDAETGVPGACAAAGGAPIVKNILTGSGGTALRWKGFSLNAEGYYRQIRYDYFGAIPPLLADQILTDIGYYATLGYFVIPKKFEIAAMGGQLFREGPDNNGNQLGGGINYYIFGNDLKIQASYTWTQDYDDVIGVNNKNQQLAILQIQALF